MYRRTAHRRFSVWTEAGLWRRLHRAVLDELGARGEWTGHTQQAHYVIKGVAGGDRHRYINTHYSKNTWVELGVYRFTGTPRVELTNTTDDGTADEDVAWDAVAFQPLSGTPKHMVVAMGGSYTSGEGAGAYSPESDRDHGTSTWNACRRSPHAWPRKVTLPGQTRTIGTLADSFDPALGFQVTACSGAETAQMTQGNPHAWGFDGNFYEKTQIDSGALSTDTTSVMLTIGGNDASFDNKIQMCVTHGCPSEASMKADIEPRWPKHVPCCNKFMPKRRTRRSR
ncbi:hypothetical protein ACIF8T_24825 [Streptomyces sp. NPDC085946]|uniref:hypothetical protein n=1 Tax=Streptomyces sp. NPDC085946 TaxID=3365744 RepID=UPI0037D52ED8